MQNNLSEILNKYAQNDYPQFPFSDDEIRSILEKGSKTNRFKKNTKKFNKKGVIIMSTLSFIILLLSSYYIFNNHFQTGFTENERNKIAETRSQNLQSTNSEHFTLANNKTKSQFDSNSIKTINAVNRKKTDTTGSYIIVNDGHNTRIPVNTSTKINSNYKDISGLEYIELTPEELKNLNIIRNDNGVVFTVEKLIDSLSSKQIDDLAKYGYHPNSKNQILLKMTKWIDSIGRHLSYKESKYLNEKNDSVNSIVYINETGKPDTLEYVEIESKRLSNISPVYSFISTKSGKLNMYESLGEYYKPASLSIDKSDFINIKERINKLKPPCRVFVLNTNNSNIILNNTYINSLVSLNLIPILIKFNHKIADSNYVYYLNVLLWFLPTQEFINALPERYGKRLSQELELLDNLNNGKITINEACEVLKGEESLLDVCRSNSDILKLVDLYPNPVTYKNLNIKLYLATNRKVQINIHDLNGKFIKNLLNSTLPMGDYGNSFDLNGIDSGVYLISFISDAGEQIVKRIIIE